MKTRCEQLGVCNATNCHPCKLSREQKKSKKDALNEKAKVIQWIPNSPQQRAYSAAGMPK